MNASLKLEFNSGKSGPFDNGHFGKKAILLTITARSHYVRRDPRVSARRGFPCLWHLSHGIYSSRGVLFASFGLDVVRCY